MFAVCPKCKHVLSKTEANSAEVCPACGLYFRKYLQALAAGGTGRDARSASAAEDEPLTDEQTSFFRRVFLYVPEEVEPWRVYGGALLFVLSLWLGWRFYFMDVPEWEMASTYLHGAMVPFHEFGHLLFRPFGEFMTLAGGSLAQWLIPVMFLAIFSLKNRDNVAASLMLWWLGTQFLDLAPYAWDAATPTQVLLTGRTGDTGGHDYIDVLGDLGLLKHAHQVARVMHSTGLIIMIAAWVWGAWILWRQFRTRRR